MPFIRRAGRLRRDTGKSANKTADMDPTVPVANVMFYVVSMRVEYLTKHLSAYVSGTVGRVAVGTSVAVP